MEWKHPGSPWDKKFRSVPYGWGEETNFLGYEGAHFETLPKND
jgi:hypothetical protein